MPAIGSGSVPLTTSTASRRPIADRVQRIRFRRAITLMIMTLLAPGSAQLLAGDRRIGRVALRLWGIGWLIAITAGLAALAWQGFGLWLLSSPAALGIMRLTLMVAAIGWAYLFMDAWRLGNPLGLRQRQRLAVVGVNGLLCFSVAGALLFAAHVVGVQRDFVITMFGDGQASGAQHGRYNVLLLGGDAGAGRWGLRPDSITVASIDAESGRTVLISLPRNLANVPFRKGSVMAKQFPQGFDCEGCYLNGVSTWAMDHTALFGKSKHPGIDATLMAVEGATGLKINYWAMVNLQGFRDLVDAVGGVKLRIRDRIPVGGLGEDVTGYIEPGVRTLNGHDTLWFARAREGSDDYSRMARQKCVMSAMLHQISPQTAVRNFTEIAKASSDMVATNLPASELDRFIALAMRAKEQKISTVSLVPPAINTGDPDFAVVHQLIEDGIAKAEGREQAAPAADTTETQPAPAADPQPAPTKQKLPRGPQPVTGGSVGSLSDGYAANQAEDLGSAC